MNRSLTFTYDYNTDLNTFSDFVEFLKHCNDDLLMMLTQEHESKVEELAPGHDVDIQRVTAHESTFKAVPQDPNRPDHFNDISCDITLEYIVFKTDY